MIINRSCLKEFAEKLHFLPSSLTKSDLLTDPFRLHQENELAIYYSPHNEFINRDASLVIANHAGFFPDEDSVRNSRRKPFARRDS